MTQMNFNYNDYEINQYLIRATNRSVTERGFRVGDWLFVSYADARGDSYRIYRINDGLPALNTTFKEASDAIQCAEWLDKTYVDRIEDMSYFCIWTEYPHAEIFRWTHLTIPNGEKYMLILEAMEKQKNVRWDDVSKHLD